MNSEQNCYGYAFGVKNWLYPYYFDEDDYYGFHSEVMNRIRDGESEKDIETFILDWTKDYMLESWGQSLRVIHNLEELRGGEEAVAYKICFRLPTKENFSDILLADYSPYYYFDFHYRVLRNGGWHEKQGRGYPNIASTFETLFLPWKHNNIGDYDSQLLLLALRKES